MIHPFGGISVLLHPISERIVMTTWTYIFTIALAAAFVVVVLMMVLAIIYYRWRLRDSHRTLARFIRESLEMKNEIK